MAALIKPTTEQGRKPRSAPTAVAFRRRPMQVEFVEVDGIRLRVGIRPGRGRPLLLFNGIGANLDLVQPFADALEEMELIIFDMPGTGESPPLRFPKRFAGLARMTAKLLDRLGYTGAINIAGVSWGGAMAQQFAIQYPERTNRLILAATSAGMVALPAKPNVLLRMTTPRRYISRSYLARVAPEIYGGLMRRRPDLIERHGSLTRRPALRGYIYQLLAGAYWTSAHRLYKLRCPTLVMGGDDDPIMPLVNTRLLYWLIPKSYMHVVRGGGHLFLVVRANECAAVIRRFINERRYDGTDPQDYYLARGLPPDGHVELPLAG
ncbi:poly(3-hydroxyalkanoate) depolymerase [Salinisphaera sp. PC39]